jgi:hypothetical protein
MCAEGGPFISGRWPIWYLQSKPTVAETFLQAVLKANSINARTPRATYRDCCAE